MDDLVDEDESFAEFEVVQAIKEFNGEFSTAASPPGMALGCGTGPIWEWTSYAWTRQCRIGFLFALGEEDWCAVEFRPLHRWQTGAVAATQSAIYGYDNARGTGLQQWQVFPAMRHWQQPPSMQCKGCVQILLRRTLRGTLRSMRRSKTGFGVATSEHHKCQGMGPHLGDYGKIQRAQVDIWIHVANVSGRAMERLRSIWTLSSASMQTRSKDLVAEHRPQTSRAICCDTMCVSWRCQEPDFNRELAWWGGLELLCWWDGYWQTMDVFWGFSERFMALDGWYGMDQVFWLMWNHHTGGCKWPVWQVKSPAALGFAMAVRCCRFSDRWESLIDCLQWMFGYFCLTGLTSKRGVWKDMNLDDCQFWSGLISLNRFSAWFNTAFGLLQQCIYGFVFVVLLYGLMTSGFDAFFALFQQFGLA